MVKKFLPDSGCRCRRSLCVVRGGDRACVRSRMIGLRRMSGAVVAAASMLEEKAGGTGADGGNTPCLAHAPTWTGDGPDPGNTLRFAMLSSPIFFAGCLYPSFTLYAPYLAIAGPLQPVAQKAGSFVQAGNTLVHDGASLQAGPTVRPYSSLGRCFSVTKRWSTSSTRPRETPPKSTAIPRGVQSGASFLHVRRCASSTDICQEHQHAPGDDDERA